MKINLSYFRNDDASEVVSLIHRLMFETNINDYSMEAFYEV